MSETDTASLPASKDAYSFDETTREYLGRVEVFLSPLEATYFLPRNVVAIAPPEPLGANERARLNADGSAWEVVPDFRRVMLWETPPVRRSPTPLPSASVCPRAPPRKRRRCTVTTPR